MSTEFVEDTAKPSDVNIIPEKKADTASISDNQIDDYLAKFLDINENAKSNERTEKAMPLREGLKTFPKAAFWSVVLSAAIIMEGYDTNLLNSFYSFPGFNKKYGRWYEEEGEYQVPAKWQTALSMAVNVGEIAGLYTAGFLADRLGYKKTLIGGMTAVIGLIFIVFFSPNVQVLLVGEILLGIPWGIFQTLTVAYASEVCPMVLRIYLTTFINACWVIGQLISSCVLRGALSMSSATSYQIPFAIQWVWPIPIIIGIYLAPESPWWLVKKGKNEEAKKAIKRLITPNENLPSVDLLAEAMFNKMQLTIREEEESSAGTLRDCFNKQNFRRTRIASIVWAIQNMTGSALMGYSTYFYTQAGLNENMAFTFSIIQYVIGLIATLVSWVLSTRYGRFDLYFGGLCANFCVLLTVGCLGFSGSSGASWAVGSLLLVFTFIYDASVGPITYCVVSEIPSTMLRTKTIILARNLFDITGIIVAVITPYMLNPTAWNWKAKTGLFWAGFALAGIIWSWFEFPETKDRTYAELDILFRDGVPARKFKTTEVEAFNTQDLIKKIGEDGMRNLVNANDSYDKEGAVGKSSGLLVKEENAV